MAIWSIYADKKHYRYLGFDRDQMFSVYGDDPRKHIDVNYEATSYLSVWKPVDVNFADDGAGLSGDLIPDISEHNGRLFLSAKAYDVLKDLIANDGEFLPVRYENGDAWYFNPLSIAEDVGGLDEKRSVKNEWGDIENIAFIENKVKSFAVFRCRFDNNFNVFCQDSVKNAIEGAGLKGVYFTPDLGNPYSIDYAKDRSQG